MTESEIDDARRQVKQRLESLLAAGIDRIPRPPLSTTPKMRSEPVETTIVTAEIPASPRPTPRKSVAVSPPPLVLASTLFALPPLEAGLPVHERSARLAELAQQVSVCVRCPQLASRRNQTVFGEGAVTARLMFIGEGPGEEEDRTGRPFVGKAGVLLTDMITKGMGLTREEVYIANIVKSRPLNTEPNRTSDNRPPTAEEIGHCLPYLEEQIAIICPEFLCLLGKTPVATLLETALPMNRMRGRWFSYRGIPTIATWHPSYLLRNPAAKKETWEDLQMLMKRMGLKPPARGRTSE